MRQETLYPLEFVVWQTPRSHRASPKSKQRWKDAIKDAARDRIRQTDELGLLDHRPVAVTIFYFLRVVMEGDIDNIVKPILDALIGVAYLNDQQVERVLAQKFEPDVDPKFTAPSASLAALLDSEPPLVYVRVDDDLSWRTIP